MTPPHSHPSDAAAAVAHCYWSLLYDVPEVVGARGFRQPDVAKAILETMARVARASGAVLLLHNHKSRELEFSCSHGLPGDPDPASPRGEAIAHAVDEALRAERSVPGTRRGLAFVACPLHGPIRRPESPQDLPADDRRRFPPELLVKQLGAIYLERKGDAFTADELHALDALAGLASTKLVLARLYEVATIDPVTGFSQRRELEQNLQVERTVATHINVPLALVMLDVDGFDALHHAHGRRATDQLLRHVAGSVQGVLRSQDLGFRYGPGKLVLLLPGADEVGAEETARRALASIDGVAPALGSVTLSAGIAVFPHHADRSDELIKKADQALFRAESSGGGRVEVWNRGISKYALRTDKLLGIITGDPKRDNRNVLLLLDAIVAVNAVRERGALLSTILDMMLALTGGERGMVLLPAVPGRPSTPEEDLQPAPPLRVTRPGPRDPKTREPSKRIEVKLRITVAQDARKRPIRVRDYSEVVCRKVAESGLPISILDRAGDDDPAIEADLIDLGLRMVIAVPLLVRSRLAGVLYVDSSHAAREVGEADLVFFQALAREVGVALDNRRLYEDNERARREVEELNQRLAAKVETQAHELEETREVLATAVVELNTKYDYGRIVGKSERMQRVYRLLDRVTDTSVPVLIQGESGTGKELVAKAIHYNGPRKRKRFVTVNCAAIAPTLLESELFGHVRGAFTGADRDKAGLFEQAHKGTLFLDEVQDMSASMQRELLRVLQEKELRRVGGKDIIKVDVRIIAATNRNLKDLMQQNLFREDLYYRLNVVTIELPPLRERIEDIPLLVDRFFVELCESHKRRLIRVTRRAMRKLCRGRYSGNVRELQNLLERSLLMLDGDVLDESDVDLEVTDATGLPRLGASPVSSGASGAQQIDMQSELLFLPYKAAAEAFKAEYVRRLLERHNGNVTKASEESGLVRSSLHKIMRKLNVDAKEIRRRHAQQR